MFKKTLSVVIAALIPIAGLAVGIYDGIQANSWFRIALFGLFAVEAAAVVTVGVFLADGDEQDLEESSEEIIKLTQENERLRILLERANAREVQFAPGRYPISEVVDPVIESFQNL